MAMALESIAVYLAFRAHAAQLANDSALRLRLASYGFAAVIGAMNLVICAWTQATTSAASRYA